MSQESLHLIWQQRARRERLARERAEELLEEKSLSLYTASERLRLLFENTADGIIVHTEEGVIREVNSEACTNLGYSRSELIEMSMHEIELNPQEQMKKIWKDWEALPGLVEGTYQRKDGSKFPVEVRLTRYVDLEETLFVALIRDISTRKENEKALRQLANELTLAQERHRRDFAITLHDNIAQTLAAARYRVATLEPSLEGEDQKNEAQQIKSLLHECIVQTRQLMFDLSSPVLYESGIGAALRSHARFLNEQYECKFVVDDDMLPVIEDAGLKVLVYHLGKELLTNAAKHAKPSLVMARFSVKGRNLILAVEDDGCGFPEQLEFRAGPDSGYGLFSIRERLKHYGGSIDISRPASGGSRVEVCIDLDIGR